MTVVTLISHEWIETLFRVDPDGGSGLLEWIIVVAMAAATLLFRVSAPNGRNGNERQADGP